MIDFLERKRKTKLALKYYLDGNTFVSSCEAAGVSRQAIDVWVKEHPELREMKKIAFRQKKAAKKAKLVADAEDALTRSLRAATVREIRETIEVKTDADGNQTEIVKTRIITEKEVRPQAALVMFTLDRMSDDYKQQNQHGTLLGSPDNEAAKERNRKLIEDRMQQLQQKQLPSGQQPTPQEQEQQIEAKFENIKQEQSKKRKRI